MGNLNILFLGASRLVGLLERFKAAAQSEDVELKMLSVEDDSPWHAIGAAGLAAIIPGPRFLDGVFSAFLRSVMEKHSIDILIPSIDTATVALSAMRLELDKTRASSVVSDAVLCPAMYDKREAHFWFEQNKIPIPIGQRWPKIVKPRWGSSSRNVTVLEHYLDLFKWEEDHELDDYVLEEFIQGTEYSVDAYVSKAGNTVGLVSRRRVVTCGGEVMVTVTEHHERVLQVVRDALAYPGWRGPLVFQVIDDGQKAWMIECNPRFGGGATCSIEAGLDMPRWIIREHLGRPLPESCEWKGGLCMTRSRRDHFVQLEGK